MNRFTKHWLTRRVLAAVVTAVIVFGAVAAGLLLRPEAYDARIGLLAVPRTTPASAERPDFGVVVANSLPALVEVAHSASAISSAAARVPDAPDDPSAITDGVTLELVPASGLARLTVRSGDPDVAAGLANELAGELVQANLLSPAATLRVLDPVPTVQQASPDLLLAVGLALTAGVVAGAAALGAAVLWWPHPTRRIRRLLGEAGVGHAVAVISDDGSGEALETLRLLQETAGRPLRLVVSEPQLVDAAARISDALDLTPVPVADERRIAVGIVTHIAATPGSLRAAVGTLPDPHEVVAVILSDGRAGDESSGESRTGADRNAESDPSPEFTRVPATHHPESDSRPPADRPAAGRHATGTTDAERPPDGSRPVAGPPPGDPPEDDPVPGEAAPTSAAR
ncbi:hypothetical protein [Rhodococcus sp. IEGM 1408]|uniref:hypothetical protein n=1 Tax=Rhodococcus sp. IEGM 1408 TaxID=3082220 RepID=UPI0029547FE2|nr:hypothetical protein [Rhodococcus sp. IEGM 1408]MDV8002534.1 hypothetical protein [Rhodococcus sp. IEGM 1408]